MRVSPLEVLPGRDMVEQQSIADESLRSIGRDASSGHRHPATPPREQSPPRRKARQNTREMSPRLLRSPIPLMRGSLRFRRRSEASVQGEVNHVEGFSATPPVGARASTLLEAAELAQPFFAAGVDAREPLGGPGRRPPSTPCRFFNRSPGPPVGGPNSSNQGDPLTTERRVPSSSTSPIPDEALSPPASTASPVQSGDPRAPVGRVAACKTGRDDHRTRGCALRQSQRQWMRRQSPSHRWPCQGATSPSAAAPGDDQFAGPLPGGAAGLGAVGLRLCRPCRIRRCCLPRPGGFRRPAPVTRDPEMNSRPVAGSAEIDAIGRSAASRPCQPSGPAGCWLDHRPIGPASRADRGVLDPSLRWVAPAVDAAAQRFQLSISARARRCGP